MFCDKVNDFLSYYQEKPYNVATFASLFNLKRRFTKYYEGVFGIKKQE